MSIVEILLIAIGLSMDAFAVAISKGLCVKKVTIKNAGLVGLYFGLFQAIMPVLGYLLGIQFKVYIEAVDHWIAFILLSFIGIKMVRGALTGEDSAATCAEDELAFKKMIVLAVATSIDALAVGISFAFLEVDIVLAASLIGVTTFLLSCLGVKIGNVFGSKYQKKAGIAGGVILVAMGLKILIEHLFF